MSRISYADLQGRVEESAGEGTSQPRATSGFSLRVRRWIRQVLRQRRVRAGRRGRVRRTGSAPMAAATVLAVAVAAPAREYNPPITTLVKNTYQPTERVVLLNAFQDGLYQGFRTGPNLGGYELTSILLYVSDTHGSRYMTIDAGIYLYNGSGFTRVTDLMSGGHLRTPTWSRPRTTTSCLIARQVARTTTPPNFARPTSAKTTPVPRKAGRSTIISAFGARAIPIGKGTLKASISP